jgi:hypothetical protein
VAGTETKPEKPKNFERTADFRRFKDVMGRLLKVSKKELDERLEQYAKSSARKRSAKKTERRKVG